MRIVLGISIALSLIAGCGGGRHYQEDDSWAQEHTSDSTSTSTSGDVDAGVDAGSADPRRDRAMALLARSCTPCHRRAAPIDPDATARGVYLETEDDIRQHTSTYTVGNTPTNLAAIVGQRAEGYELMVGPDMRSPMPPRGSSYPPLTVEEAQAIRDWIQAIHGIR